MSGCGRNRTIAVQHGKVRFLAKRKAGILLKKREMAKGSRPEKIGNPKAPDSDQETSSDIGISKKQSS